MSGVEARVIVNIFADRPCVITSMIGLPQVHRWMNDFLIVREILDMVISADRYCGGRAMDGRVMYGVLGVS